MTQADGTFQNDDVKKDVTPAAKSERDTEAKQDSSPSDSTTAQDPEVDEKQIAVLPGTGGPDDVGDIEVDESELNLSGDSIPGHPKPGSGD